MKSIFVLPLSIVALCAACSPEETGPAIGENPALAASDSQDTEAGDISIAGRNTAFLVKLGTSISTETSKVGDPIAGVLIDPGTLRGGRVEGTVTRADRSFLNFTFDTLHFRGETYKIGSVIRSVASSHGVAGQDDMDQRIRIQGDGIIAYGTKSAINEGAEIGFIAWEIE